MTKLRDPLTFPHAVTRIAAVLTFDGMARAMGRSEGLMRAWGDPCRRELPSIEQARALDVAYRAAGGEGAPMCETLTALVEADIAAATACHRELAEDIAGAALDLGQLIAAAMPVAQPGPTQAQVMRAIAEAEEADSRIGRIRNRLRSFLHPAQGGQS